MRASEIIDNVHVLMTDLNSRYHIVCCRSKKKPKQNNRSGIVNQFEKQSDAHLT